MMDRASNVAVLLVSGSNQAFSLCQQRLERKGCHCHRASSHHDLKALLTQKQFDIVLAIHPIECNTKKVLAVMLSGSRITLFYALPVEEGGWWVPVLRIGEECIGEPALRPREFSIVLDVIVKELKADRPTIGKSTSRL
jgi:hypothetical protein